MHRLNWKLLSLLLLFMVGAWIQGRVLPVLEGGDEWLQLAYVEHLRTTGTLPDRTLNETGPIRQQSGQPPLTYALSALAALHLPTFDAWTMMDNLQRDSNNWFSPPDAFNRRDNNNVFYLSNEPANTPQIVAVVRAVRWAAPLYGVVAILAMYGAAWEFFQNARWALAATGLFAFTPTFLHTNSFLTTDGGAAALGTAVLWLSLVIARRGLTWRGSLGLGLGLGLAGLAKVSTLLLAPAAGVALLLGTRTGDNRAARFIGHGALVALPLMLTFGVWALWGWLTYGDPLGTQTHRFPGQYFDPPLGVGAVLARMPEVYLSYWGKFASAVYLHPATYAALTGLLVVGIIGYASVGAKFIPPRLMAVVIVAAVTLFAGVWYWVATINFITGRLMFPAHGALVLLAAGGFYTLARRVPPLDFMLRALLVVPVAVVGLVFTPMALYTAYTPPPLAVLPPALTHTPYTFGESVRFVGWHADSTTIQAGDLYTVTLCWQVIAPAPRPAAYSLKIVKDGLPAGERTTVHGLGRYDWRQWEPGYTFCEALDVPIGAVEAGVAYDLLLVMLDAQTGAVDWPATTPDGTPVQFPVLGQVQGG